MNFPDIPTLDVPVQGYHHTLVDQGQGESVLLIHGSLCDWRYWRWQLPALSSTHRVLAPSLRSYWPGTPDGAHFNPEQHALDLDELLARLSPRQKVHVLGHSRGGHVALLLAQRAPERIASLTLADPGFPTPGAYSSAPLFDQVAQRLNSGDTDQAMALFVDTVNGSGTWKQMTRWFRDMVRDNAHTLLEQQAEPGTTPALEWLKKMDAPLVFVTGQDSPPRYRHCMDLIRSHRPEDRLVTIPHAAHGMNLANPKAFNQALLDIIGS
ncbi:alpha/beta fold hydrolase [Alcaligenes sp. SDU_A2]|uniref:alpha/beta fold hydrolase n=1 Tax=Alcaligenes sp. SDU_A2 TaxID=3136634 RepID=UPI002CCF9985|nr:alpha/beta hydrolase [Alcaligenes sp.]HRL26845.1 alpha/beta hydrolase [Alcaligenes sp.]